MKNKMSRNSPAEKPAVKALESGRVVENRWYYLLIVAFAFVLYGNTIGNRYALDDTYITAGNPLVSQGLSALPTIFSSSYIVINAEEGGQHKFGYRPIAKATYAIEAQFFGNNPHVSHFINVLLYALTGLLLFKLLRRLLKTFPVLFILTTVLIFMAHPLHTEVVASLKNREELLSFLFGLLALSYFLKFYDTGRKVNILWGSLMFVLGVLSKVNIVTFIVVIPLMFYFFTDIKTKTLLWLSASLLFFLILAATIPRLFLGETVRQMQFIENPLLFGSTLAERFGTGMMVLLFYLKMLIWPHPMVFYYGYNMIPVSGLSSFWVWFSAAIHIGLLIYALMNFRRKHLLSFAILFYLVNIAMFSNLVAFPTGIVAERFLYVASLGFALALAYGLFQLTGVSLSAGNSSAKARNYLLAGLLVLLIPATAKTIDRNKDWKDELTLFAADSPHMVKSAKANFIYATNLRSSVVERLKNGVPRNRVKSDAQICITHFKRSVDVYPDYADAWNNLGEVYLLILNEPDSAVINFEQAVKANPSFTAAFYNLGYTYQITRKPEQAIMNYEKALELEPYEIRTMSNLALLYQETGETNRAIQLNEDIITLEPGLDLPYINLGTYAMRAGDAATALEYFTKAIELNPNNFDLNMKLRNYFAKVGDSIRADYYLDLARRSGKPKQ
ncbi:MAG: tetratricopeptide repeat protein [Lentimicrobium sp.]|jgi:tetratricopeptide (TPR) repeat protein|nr:tetratricopeptide repeat protein [Lentimicrobium sp.]